MTPDVRLDWFGRFLTRTGLSDSDSPGDVSFSKMVTVVGLAVFAPSVWYNYVVLRLPPDEWLWAFGATAIGAGFTMKSFVTVATVKAKALVTRTQIEASATVAASANAATIATVAPDELAHDERGDD